MEHKNDAHVTDSESLKRDYNMIGSLLKDQETTPEDPIDSIDKTPVQAHQKHLSLEGGDFVVRMEDLEYLKQQITEKDNIIKNYREANDGFIKTFSTRREELSKASKDIERLERESAGFQRQIGELTEKLENYEADSKVFQQQIGDLNEKLANYEAAKSKERKDMEDLRRYRSLYEKFAKMIRNQLSGIKYYLKNRDLEGIEAVVDSIFEQFEEIRPAVDTPYNFDEHTLYEPISGDSMNLFIEEVKKPGYKLEGIITEKATVTVYRKKQKEINSETGN